MAVPFRKTSKAKRNKRRSHHGIGAVSVVSCDNCGVMIKPHHVCKECGFYKGKEVKTKS